MSEPTVPESDYLHMEAEVDRLKLMHLSAESELMLSQAREKALRAIAQDMLTENDWGKWSDEEIAGFESACREWDERAKDVT